MKNVFLIGDSIRNGAANSPGYGCYVQEYLGEGYSVFQPNDNCRFAQYTQRYFPEWICNLPVSASDISVVHWNNGLWDVLEQDGSECIFTDLPFYLSSLRKIHTLIKHYCPNAKIVFATSTPVIEQMRPQWTNRRNEVILQYNIAASELMNKLGVYVDDLYPAAAKLDALYRPDWVHYKESGSRILAQAVADYIKALYVGG